MTYAFTAIKGRQKSTEFYLTCLTYTEVDRLVVLPHDFLGDDLFNDDLTMQRLLNWKRVRKEMKNYLIGFPDAFYSAITLFIIPRDLSPLREGHGYEFAARTDGRGEGELLIESSCVLFPGDGQHRVASIKEALVEAPELAGYQIPAVLIPFHSRGRVRQLFSDLNLNAKPVSRSIGLAFETRDPIAIISRRVGQLVRLFRGRVRMRANSLPPSSPCVITISTLYQANHVLLDAILGESREDVLGDLIALPVDDRRINALASELAAIWNAVIDSLSPWSRVIEGTLEPSVVRQHYVFAHGVGWQAIAHAAARIIEGNQSTWRPILQSTLRAIDWRRSCPLWQGVAMMGEHMNNTSAGVQAAAQLILKRIPSSPTQVGAAPNRWHTTL